MKKILATLFFLGLTTTGFAQSPKTVDGNAALWPSSPGFITIGCAPSEATCFTLTKNWFSDSWRLQAPTIGVDVNVLLPTVNGVPAEDLPPRQDGGDKEFRIEYTVEDSE